MVSPITSPMKDPALHPDHRGERREPIGQEMTQDTPPSSSSSNQVEALRDIQPEEDGREEEEDEVDGVDDIDGVGVNGDERGGEGQEEFREVEGQTEEKMVDGYLTRRK